MADAKFRADLAYVAAHFDQFFGRAQVRNKLNSIHATGLTGWEKWWQVEFVTWLAEHDGVGDWLMEERFAVDARKWDASHDIAIDVAFRLKGFSTKEYLFLELKQDKDWRHCINAMIRDARKVDCSKGLSIPNGRAKRNFFVCGVYLLNGASKAEVNDYVERRVEAATDFEIARALVHTRLVRGTPYGYTVF